VKVLYQLEMAPPFRQAAGQLFWRDPAVRMLKEGQMASPTRIQVRIQSDLVPTKIQGVTFRSHLPVETSGSMVKRVRADDKHSLPTRQQQVLSP
jgi:hypothetical protein